jgi:hypothetical protein
MGIDAILYKSALAPRMTKSNDCIVSTVYLQANGFAALCLNGWILPLRCSIPPRYERLEWAESAN